MKILHTADWHIGKLVHKIHMTHDQKYILEKFSDYIGEAKPDVLIIAGDVYDRSIPPTDAVELLDSVLTGILIEHGTRIIMISGNHDNPERLKFGSSILKSQGLHISTMIEDIYNPVVIDDEHGPVFFHTIPFLEPEIVRSHFNDDTIRTFDDAFARIIDSMDIDKTARNICITHGYITSGSDMRESDSEKPFSIGGTDIVSHRHFEKFDYTAMGHLHGPQTAGSDRIRYSGSIMKYSFSEADHRKGFLEINLTDRNLSVEKIELKPERDFRIIRGEMKELMKPENYSMGNSQDYIKAILTDPGEILSPFPTLKSVYPNLLSLEYDRNSSENRSDNEEKNLTSIFRQNPADLFEKFYNTVEDDPLKETDKNIIGEIYGAAMNAMRQE